MRIAFDHQIFELQGYGGISRYFTRLVQGLLDMGQQAEVFAPLHQNNYLTKLPQGIVNGRHIDCYPPKTARIIFAHNQFRSWFQIKSWKPNLIHETYYPKRGSALRTCPTVITIHDMIHELYPDKCLDNGNTLELKHRAIERADHIICVSENTKLDLMRFYKITDHKLSVVHHGVDEFVSQNSFGSVECFSGKPFLLYVGQRVGYKNFEGLLRAIACSPRLLTDFNIIAFGGPVFTPNELALISSLGFFENQVLHKTGNDELLGRLYGTARAFVYPSLYEGFGIPPLEAMAHNCPVISSSSSSMPEVIGTAGEYFDPNDLDDICRAIESVVYSDERVKCLRQAGVERLSAFSWEKCSRETFDVYQSLVK